MLWPHCRLEKKADNLSSANVAQTTAKQVISRYRLFQKGCEIYTNEKKLVRVVCKTTVFDCLNLLICDVFFVGLWLNNLMLKRHHQSLNTSEVKPSSIFLHVHLTTIQ